MLLLKEILIKFPIMCVDKILVLWIQENVQFVAQLSRIKSEKVQHEYFKRGQKNMLSCDYLQQ